MRLNPNAPVKTVASKLPIAIVDWSCDPFDPPLPRENISPTLRTTAIKILEGERNKKSGEKFALK